MPERIWHLDRIVVVIGWLDHCIEFSEDFDATILKTLEDHQTECNEEVYPFTPVQITNKLIDLSRSSTIPKYAPDYPRLQEVKVKGSQCFPGLKDEIREKANIATRKYAARRQNPQSQVGLVPKLPRHEDDGVTDDELANSHPDEGSHSRSAGSRVTRQDQFSNPSSRDKNKATSHGRRTSESSLRVPNTRTHHNSLSICNFCGQVTSIEEINCSGTDSLDHSWESTFEERVLHTGQMLQIDDQKWEEVIEPLKKLVKQIICQNQEEMRRLKGFHDLEMTEVTRERDHLKREHVRLTAQNRHFEVAHEKRKAAAEHDPLEGDLLRQYRVIANLQKQNATLERDIPYIKEVLLDQPKLLSMEAAAITLQMQSELESLYHLYEHQKPAAAGISSGSKLGALLKIFNPEKFMSLYKNGETELADWIGKIDIQLLLGHVVLTIVKQKVFDTSFPASGAQNFWWALLQEHQKIQMEFGGWQQLNCFDKLAHKRIIEGEEFKQMLSREATKHSNGLIEVLAPLFGLQLGDYHSAQGESPYTPDNLSKDIHYRLLEIFRTALKFKSLSVITRQRYEFAVHSEESVRQTENPFTTALSNQSPGDCDNCPTNELRRIASLRIYAAGPRDHVNPFNDALVKVKNFLNLDSSEERPEILHISSITSYKPDQDSEISNPKNDCRAESEQEPGLGGEYESGKEKQEMDFRGHSESTVSNEEVAAPPLRASSTPIQLINDNQPSQTPGGRLPTEKKFICKLCLEMFTRSEHLKRHIELDRCFICSCGLKFKRRTTLRKHQKGFDHMEDGVAGNDISEISCQAYPEHTGETTASESTSVDSDLQERHKCKRCQKPHSSRWELQQHLDNNTCSQCEVCHIWSKSEAEHAVHWQECHNAPAKSTSSPIGERETRLSNRDEVHEQPRRGNSNQIPQLINRGVEGSSKVLSVAAVSNENPSVLPLVHSARTSTLQLATHLVTQSSRAIVRKPTNNGSTMKRAHDSERGVPDGRSSSEQSRKRRKSARSLSPSPRKIKLETASLNANGDIYGSEIARLESGSTRKQSTLGAVKHRFFGKAGSSI